MSFFSRRGRGSNPSSLELLQQQSRANRERQRERDRERNLERIRSRPTPTAPTIRSRTFIDDELLRRYSEARRRAMEQDTYREVFREVFREPPTAEESVPTPVETVRDSQGRIRPRGFLDVSFEVDDLVLKYRVLDQCATITNSNTTCRPPNTVFEGTGHLEGYKIKSVNTLAISVDNRILFVRGSNHESDNRVSHVSFDSHMELQEFLSNMINLLRQYRETLGEVVHDSIVEERRYSHIEDSLSRYIVDEDSISF